MKATVLSLLAALPLCGFVSCQQPAPVVIHRHTIVKPKPTPKPKPKPKPRPDNPESFRAVESAN